MCLSCYVEIIAGHFRTRRIIKMVYNLLAAAVGMAAVALLVLAVVLHSPVLRSVQTGAALVVLVAAERARTAELALAAFVASMCPTRSTVVQPVSASPAF